MLLGQCRKSKSDHRNNLTHNKVRMREPDYVRTWYLTELIVYCLPRGNTATLKFIREKRTTICLWNEQQYSYIEKRPAIRLVKGGISIYVLDRVGIVRAKGAVYTNIT